VDYLAFSEEYLAGLLRLCEAEGWPSFPADPARAFRALTAPGVVTVVAVEDGDFVGFAQMLTDGEIQAYLCDLAVASESRAQGIGTRLVEEAFARSGARRVDLLALDESAAFYQSFRHRMMPGYRIYPGSRESDGPGVPFRA
jgi:ribosomal protein S18 acetylase RimI-like enzyme